MTHHSSNRLTCCFTTSSSNREVYKKNQKKLWKISPHLKSISQLWRQTITSVFVLWHFYFLLIFSGWYMIQRRTKVFTLSQWVRWTGTERRFNPLSLTRSSPVWRLWTQPEPFWDIHTHTHTHTSGSPDAVEMTKGERLKRKHSAILTVWLEWLNTPKAITVVALVYSG